MMRDKCLSSKSVLALRCSKMMAARRMRTTRISCSLYCRMLVLRRQQLERAVGRVCHLVVSRSCQTHTCQKPFCISGKYFYPRLTLPRFSPCGTLRSFRHYYHSHISLSRAMTAAWCFELQHSHKVHRHPFLHERLPLSLLASRSSYLTICWDSSHTYPCTPARYRASLTCGPRSMRQLDFTWA